MIFFARWQQRKKVICLCDSACRRYLYVTATFDERSPVDRGVTHPSSLRSCEMKIGHLETTDGASLNTRLKVVYLTPRGHVTTKQTLAGLSQRHWLGLVTVIPLKRIISRGAFSLSRWVWKWTLSGSGLRWLL